MATATSDYPVREDFVWFGVEQLSEVPEDHKNSCPICMMSLVPDDSSTTEDDHENDPLQNDQDLQHVQAAGTTVTNNTEQNMTGTNVSNIIDQDNLNSLAISVGSQNLNFDDNNNDDDDNDAYEPEDGPFICIRTCRHIFHTACLRKWLSKPMNKTCPSCRRLLFAAPCRHAYLLQDLDALVRRFQHHESIEIACLLSM
ncbi:hypothetical protein PMIN02_001067 [Paraphaeosphaeria minitans]|uniref:RING-type domain-containing protein n=1 Tax=Paraphaeosphaeria minitans TaxID=565426 RepID=A0A9P6GHS7_9PLEO|nr:hypothetical protein PMIN01_06778 [Paraphaeosphaeria minitans]